jgi:predicted dehydrogenase
VHRTAIAFDPRAELVAGAFSSSIDKTREMGRRLFLDGNRLYGSYAEMAQAEAGRTDGIDIAVVAAPNALHYPAVKAFLEAGIHVVCEKPFVPAVEQARELIELAETKGLICALTHNYTGYPLVKEARHLVHSGALGRLRMVAAEYPQDGLELLEERDELPWRLDGETSGGTFCLGDIGTHVENLAAYLTGLSVRRLRATLGHFTGGRLDDDVRVELEYEGGAAGHYWASKVAPGYENALRIRVFGSEASLEWEQEHPNHMTLRRSGEPPRRITRGQRGTSEAARRAARLPEGHPEGYFESFANLYREIFDALADKLRGDEGAGRGEYDFPDMYDGLRAAEFMRLVVESSGRDSAWVEWG